MDFEKISEMVEADKSDTIIVTSQTGGHAIGIGSKDGEGSTVTGIGWILQGFSPVEGHPDKTVYAVMTPADALIAAGNLLELATGRDDLLHRDKVLQAFLEKHGDGDD